MWVRGFGAADSESLTMLPKHLQERGRRLQGLQKHLHGELAMTAGECRRTKLLDVGWPWSVGGEEGLR